MPIHRLKPRAGRREKALVEELSERSREILRHIVEAYVATGEPVGSRTVSRKFRQSISPATIRNVMADLQEAGFLHAPHTSAGRLPTDAGLSFFVDGLLQVGQLSMDERRKVEDQCRTSGHSLTDVLEKATETLSGLSHCAGLVLAPKLEKSLRHIEFVHLGPSQALVVLVFEGGLVENRTIEVPQSVPPSVLVEATNYLNAKLVGRTLAQARDDILLEIEEQRARLDSLTQRVVQAGLGIWSGDSSDGYLIVKGQANLLEDVSALEDLEAIRKLIAALETKKNMAGLIDAVDHGEGVQVFIGAENDLFGLSGCATIIAPLRGDKQRIVGAIGVVGPTRIDYARIVPLVDYTAKVVGQIIG